MIKQKPSTQILAFFSLFIFLFMDETQIQSLPQLCSSSCGDIQNITYPFRLTTDPTSCGDPDYELSCENNKTILNYYNGKFYVKQISYNMRNIRVVDVNLANGTCNLPYHSVTRDEVNGDRRYRGGFQVPSYASFMNCSRIVSDPAYISLPCFGGNTSRVYVTYDYNSYALSNLLVGCTFLSMLPLDAPNRIYPHSYDDLMNLVESGFNLAWSVECRNCLLSNATCSITKFETPYNFSCSSNRSIISIVILISFSAIVNILLVVTLLGRFFFAPIIIFVFLIHKFLKERKAVDNVEIFLSNQQSLMPKRYSYSDIVAVTNHFRDELGKGGFGSVYKGKLPGDYMIAVKMLENTKFSAEEFISEVSTIGRIHHVNVVRLVGFCSEGNKRALIYEYMPNGSLDKHIFSKEGRAQSFSWEKLLEIALGTARGIEYLHGGCDVCILHFDIKPHNILLDWDFVPKVADFGLAKLYPKDFDFVSVSTTRGTIGYIAPELVSRNFGSVSSKSDVYSFGMLLLEIAGGRKNVDAKAKNSSKVYFPSWVYDRLEVGEDLELENVSEMEIGIARKLCIVGLWCIQVRPSDRPSMTKVMEMLGGGIEDLTMPPKPFSSSPQHLSTREPQSDSSIELISESMEACLYGESSGYSHQSNV